MKYRVLIDTNVFIYLEDSKLNKDFWPQVSRLHKLCNDNGVTLLLHSTTKKDLLKDSDKERGRIMIEKMSKYPLLDFAKSPDANFYSKLGTTSLPESNSFIDENLLYALFSDAVHFLVTNDGGLRQKGAKLSLEDRVFDIFEFLDFLTETFEPSYQKFPELVEDFLSNIGLDENIFDSLKEDYPIFIDWYKNKAREGRKAWLARLDGAIVGICIFDKSNQEYKGEMKICTFKVRPDNKGEKIGELLLKQALIFAKKNKKKKIFIEVFKKHVEFISWLKDYGFSELNYKNNSPEELVLIKEIENNKEVISELDDKNKKNLVLKYYPTYFEPPQVKCFIVPIQPLFADKLFSDVMEQQKLPIFEGLPCDRAIKKAYICNSNVKNINIGDLVLFYLSKSSQSLVALGVIDDTLRSNLPDEVLNFVGKRSVYKPNEIEEKVKNSKSPTLAVKFWYIGALHSKIEQRFLYERKILKSAPQSIVGIDADKYFILKSHIDI